VSDEQRNAKAEAKSAKAKAKALRPWYKKKRWWVIGLLVVIIAASATGTNSGDSGGGSGNGSDNRPTDTPTENTIDPGIGSQDATADLVSLDCGKVDAIGFRYPAVTVKNNSSKPSNYWITIVAESADGSQRYDDTIVLINSLGPGQTMTEDGLPFTNDIPSGAICKVSEFQRTAS
jgi:hypothetical protein